MFLLFELVMRYCDYDTFKTCSLLNKECSRICRKLVRELRRVKEIRCSYYIYEVYWRGKKQGLSYYANDNMIQIMDYNDGELLANYYSNNITEHINFDCRQYHAKLDYKDKVINLPKIPGYHREKISLKNMENTFFFQDNLT